MAGIEEVAHALKEAYSEKNFFAVDYEEIKLESLGERPPLEYLTGAKLTEPTPKMEEYDEMFADMGNEEIIPQCDLENPESCESCQ